MKIEKAYKVLKVPKDSNLENVKRAYKELAKKYHPDLYQDNPLADLAEEKLKEINEAYEILEKYLKNEEEIFERDEEETEEYEDIDTDKYQKHYSDSSFWNKAKKIAKNAGLKVMCYALTLYYVLQKKDIPTSEKGMIIGVLGYFILPIDLIPDFMVGLGYTDDVGAMFLAIKKISKYVDDEVKIKVYTTLFDWFNVEYEVVEKILKI